MFYTLGICLALLCLLRIRNGFSTSNRYGTWTWFATGSFSRDSPFRRRREQVRWRDPTSDRLQLACPSSLTTTQSPKDRPRIGRPDRGFCRIGRRFRRAARLLLIWWRPGEGKKVFENFSKNSMKANIYVPASFEHETFHLIITWVQRI